MTDSVDSRVVGGGFVDRIKEGLRWDEKQPSLSKVFEVMKSQVAPGEATFESQALDRGNPGFFYLKKATTGDVDSVEQQLEKLGVDLTVAPSMVSERVEENGEKKIAQLSWEFAENLKTGEGKNLAVYINYNDDEDNTIWRLGMERVGFPGDYYQYPIKVFQLKK